MSTRPALVKARAKRFAARQSESNDLSPGIRSTEFHPSNDGPRSEPIRLRTRLLIPASLRHDMIRDAAYFRAQARGFAPGSELEDWLTAEQEVDELIVRRYGQ